MAMAKVWAISTNKGGVLKTSLTTNVAGVLCKTKRVLIVDTDNQGNCLLTFGKNPDQVETTLYDVMAEGVPAESAIINVHPNIDMLPSNDDMAFLEFNMMSHPEKYPNPFYMLRNALQPVVDKYDYILVDTPPNLGLIQGNVLAFVDDVIIPFQPQTFSRRSLIKIVEAIQEFKKTHNPKLSILGVIGTLVYRNNIHAEIMKDCRLYCLEHGIRFFDTFIPRSIQFESSVAYKRLPATLADPKQAFVQKYFELMKEVQSVEQEQTFSSVNG